MPGHLALWHNRHDTLLRITGGPSSEDGRGRLPGERTGPAKEAADFYSVHIPIGISPGTLRRHNITLEYTLNLPYPTELPECERAYQERHRRDQTAMRIGLDEKNPRGRITRITPDYLAHLRHSSLHDQNLQKIRPYLHIDHIFRTQTERRQPAYYEAVLDFIPRGAELKYRIKVYSQNRTPDVIPPSIDDWYTLYVVAPTFAFEDITFCSKMPVDFGAPPVTAAPNSAVGYWSVPDITVGYWRESSVPGQTDLLTFRFDFVDVRRAINDFELEFRLPPGAPTTGAGTTLPARITNRLTFAWLVDTPRLDMNARRLPIALKWRLPSMPVISEQFDHATFTVPRQSIPEGCDLIWRGAVIATMTGGKLTPKEPPDVKPIRLMFVHYGNQSLNDYFESPNKSYDPPRTYIQTTMSDPKGTFSSRPTSNETGIGDGFNFVLESHTKTGLPAVLAINGGFLAMLAQDAPCDHAQIVKGIHRGVFEPAIGGWAGHRMLYFTEETNRAALQYGIDIMERLLPGTGRLVHPNSRLYAATANIDGALMAARIQKPLTRREDGTLATTAAADTPSSVSIRFVLADASAYRAHKPSQTLVRGQQPLWGAYEHAYIWRQRCPTHRGTFANCTEDCDTWYWIFIDPDKMKDGLFGASEDEWRAGKLFWKVRYHLFYGVSDRRAAENSVFTYGDDWDKAAGNGWFDGDYNGAENDNAAVFAAALEWIAEHPWLQVVVTADLQPEKECVGTIFVTDAIDPSIHQDDDVINAPNRPPQAVQRFWSNDGPTSEHSSFDFDAWADRQIHRRQDGLGFEYARWYREWRTTHAVWLDTALGDICRQIERAIMHPRLANTEHELEKLAQLAALIAIHEAHWSKKPLEEHITIADFAAGEFNAQHKKAYRRQEVLEPENFVLALTLQMRNAYVLRCAARWADLCHERGMLGDETLKNAGPLIDMVRAMRREDGIPALRANLDPGLQWDLDVTENVVLYNRRLLVVMDCNGGRVTHIFRMGSDGRPVTVSGNFKSYQFLGDDRRYGGQLPGNGSVFQNTVFAPNHQYVASDINESRPTVGLRHNPKTRIETLRHDGGTARVARGDFGNEEWLYPDNFNHYARRTEREGSDEVTWEYPGLSWNLRGLETGAFEQALRDYRAWILSNGAAPRDIKKYPSPDVAPFSKTIRLLGDSLHVSYTGHLPARHLAANEFSLDVYTMLMDNARQERRWYLDGHEAPVPTLDDYAPRPGAEVNACELRSTAGAVTATVRLGENCRFSEDTCEGAANRRLHRAFSDCLEIESINAGGFSYVIDVGTNART
ncbi:MAG: hypothetical protein AB7P40_18515 [Chloroflexota bacterium]